MELCRLGCLHGSKDGTGAHTMEVGDSWQDSLPETGGGLSAPVGITDMSPPLVLGPLGTPRDVLQARRAMRPGGGAWVSWGLKPREGELHEGTTHGGRQVHHSFLCWE